jgi:hypothetical protein
LNRVQRIVVDAKITPYWREVFEAAGVEVLIADI